MKANNEGKTKRKKSRRLKDAREQGHDKSFVADGTVGAAATNYFEDADTEQLDVYDIMRSADEYLSTVKREKTKKAKKKGKKPIAKGSPPRMEKSSGVASMKSRSNAKVEVDLKRDTTSANNASFSAKEIRGILDKDTGHSSETDVTTRMMNSLLLHGNSHFEAMEVPRSLRRRKSSFQEEHHSNANSPDDTSKHDKV